MIFPKYFKQKESLENIIKIIVKSTGKVIVDGVERAVKSGNVIEIPVGYRHTIIADTVMKIIEVQIGDQIDVEDKEIFDLNIK